VTVLPVVSEDNELLDVGIAYEPFPGHAQPTDAESG
jgi:hypothetical protein